MPEQSQLIQINKPQAGCPRWSTLTRLEVPLRVLVV
jgi:hypothetical protein